MDISTVALRRMMMLFKKGILIVTCHLSACAAFAATPQEVFSAEQEAILRENVWQTGTYRFATGSLRLASESVVSRLAAKDGATLVAQAELLSEMATDSVAWPQNLSKDQTKILKEILKRMINVRTRVSGLTTVYSERKGNVWVCVVALPEEEAVKVPRLTFKEAREQLLREDVLLAKEAPLDALIALRGTMGNMPEAVNRKPWEVLLSEANFGTPRLGALPRLAGRYPLGSTEVPTDEDFAKGNEAYGKGDLATAYAAFVASAEQMWTFDALNMAGNVARRLPGHSAEASALLLHAAYLKPSSPHPWVHLAFVAKAIGNEALCEQCCREAEARSPDAWTRRQLAQLRAKASSESINIEPKDSQINLTLPRERNTQ